MKRIGSVFVVLWMLCLPSLAWAKEVAGVELEPQATLREGMERLHLNGAGVRKKFFVSIYVAALYLPQKSTDAQRIIEQDLPSRVVMHMIYPEVEKENIVAGWNQGFAANHDDGKMHGLKSRLEMFNRLFGDLKQGDRIYFDYLPGQGTKVTSNQVLLGVIPGVDFKSALLRVWLGEVPVTKSLKSALLGED